MPGFFKRLLRTEETPLRQTVSWESAELEPRLMLAGDAGAVVADAAPGPAAEVAEVVPGGQVERLDALRAVRTHAPEIVFVDAAVADFEMLAGGVTPDAEVILLDPQRDGIQQISEVLRQRQNVQTLHLVSHGEAGRLQLAGRMVDAQTLQQQRHLIGQWAAALAPQADILLYGCDVAQGMRGQHLVGRLAQLSGADVAASVDRTGNAQQGGDWELEYHVGTVESSLAFAHNTLQTFAGVLPISIRAAGATGEEQMQLQIDGVTVQTWDNVGGDFNERQFQTFTYEAASGISADRIRVAFTNDLFVEGGVDRNLRVDSITVDGQTFETEDPSVLSTGTWTPQDGVTPGNRSSEVLHADGYFQYAELDPDPSGSLIQIAAAGDTGQETMELRIDGQTVRIWGDVAGDASNRQFVTYQYQAAETITADRVQIAFTNDLYEEGVVDRNLHVDYIDIDGTLIETESADVYSTGTWKPEDGTQPGFRQSETLHSDGYFQYPGQDPGTEPTTITIYAAGSTNTERMELQIDGATVRTWNNIGGNDQAAQYVAYTATVNGPITADQVRVAFTNDLFTETVDRNLRVDRIVIDGIDFETEAPSVYSTGTYLEADGMVAGFRESEYLHGNGYFQYNAPQGNPGVIGLATSIVRVDESAGSVLLSIQRTGGSDGRVTVDYSTVDATATGGEDFESRSGTLVFETGQTENSVVVPLIDDNLAEGYETFAFAIDNVTGGATLWAPRTAIVTIADDEVILPAFTDFSSLDGLTLVGAAASEADQLLLAPAVRGQLGAAYFTEPLPINADTSFQTRFQFQLDGGQQAVGADGFTFIIHNDPRGLDAIGGGGGGLAQNGILNSVAVEFDTYQNAGDINNNHLAINLNGDLTNPLDASVPLLDLNNGDVVTAWVDYNGNTDKLAVYISDTDVKPEQPLMLVDLDLPAQVGSTGYLGFTGATGGLFNNHRVLNWDFSLDTPETILPPTPGTTLVSETLISGLTLPIDIAWSDNDQNLYIAEKSGLVKVVRNGVLQTDPFIDIQNQVNDTRDRGLLDIAVHPEFETNPYVYLLFTYDPPEVYENLDDPLAGPDQKGNRAGRLIRVTADAATNYTTAVAGSEVILLGENSTWENFNAFANSTVDFDEPPAGILPDGSNLQDFIASDSESHTVGSLAFGIDGNLFVSIGDGASYNRVDPRAVRVQDIDNLSGKVLRIDPLTGDGVAGNPFFVEDDPDANRSKVYQFGLRNPFRISVDPQSGQLYVGDVGYTKWEEINAAGPGANFGWPYYEGGSGTSLRTGGYQDLPEAIAFYASGAPVTASLFALNHAADGINAIVLGSLYTGDVYPAEFQGDLFFNDLGQGLVRNANLDADGNVISVQNFAVDAAAVVSIQQGPDGTLHYVDLDDGLVGRWYFA